MRNGPLYVPKSDPESGINRKANTKDKYKQIAFKTNFVSLYFIFFRFVLIYLKTIYLCSDIFFRRILPYRTIIKNHLKWIEKITSNN